MGWVKNKILYWITGEWVLDLFFGWVKREKKKMGVDE